MAIKSRCCALISLALISGLVTFPISARISSDLKQIVSSENIMAIEDNEDHDQVFAEDVSPPPPRTDGVPGANQLETDDGCGLRGGHPVWFPYTPHDYKIMEEILQCNPTVPNEWQPMTNRTALQCAVDVAESMPAIINQFDRVLFIGDSILRQQFWNLICMLSPAMNVTAEVQVSKSEKQWIHTTYNGTLLQYSQFGWKFDQNESALYTHSFPEAVRTYTEKDAIILNAGAHYDGSRARPLQRAAIFINQMSHRSKANIFFVETADEQWPTSNGLYTGSCWARCGCEPLTPERILGIGQAIDRSELHTNMTLDDRTEPFDLFSNEGRNHSWCIPDCLPSNWKNNLSNPLLMSGRLRIVPVWRQLAERGIVHSAFPGDCTHKSIDALITMNHQLGRSMLQALAVPL